MVVLNKYEELKEIINNNNEFIIDLTNLSNYEYIRTISFLCGLTYKNGKIKKIQSKVFEITY